MSRVVVERKSIRGDVWICSSVTWVRRWAEIEGAQFTYRLDKQSVQARQTRNLFQCEIRKGVLKDGRGFYEIRDLKSKKIIKICFFKKEEYARWGDVFYESTQSDDQLRAEKVAELLKKQKIERDALAELKIEEDRRAHQTEVKENMI